MNTKVKKFFYVTNHPAIDFTANLENIINKSVLILTTVKYKHLRI